MNVFGFKLDVHTWDAPVSSILVYFIASSIWFPPYIGVSSENNANHLKAIFTNLWTLFNMILYFHKKAQNIWSTWIIIILTVLNKDIWIKYPCIMNYNYPLLISVQFKELLIVPALMSYKYLYEISANI